LRAGDLAKFKMFKDLDAAAAIVDLMGEARIRFAAETYPGKFLGLFRKGWGCFTSRKA